MPKRKLQLTVDDRTYRMLLSLQEASGASSMAEVIRQAVTLFDWARFQQDEGFTVGAFKDGVPAKEVVLPF